MLLSTIKCAQLLHYGRLCADGCSNLELSNQ
eukprot:IDg15587t1